MKALSVKPQWADLITSGRKMIETRTRRTSYRGPLLICSTQPEGMARCIANLIECRRMREEDWAAACCPPYPNAWAWVLRDVTQIEPFGVRGMQGLFEVVIPETIIQMLPPLSAEPGLYSRTQR